MKKNNYLFIVILISLLLSGCTGSEIFMNLKDKKPNNFYYTNLLAKNVKLKKITKCKAVEMNYYRELEVDDESFNKLCTFLDKLNSSNFIPAPKDLQSKPKFKLFFTNKDEKFIINVYNERYISINPWDGSYEMDYIDMNSIPKSINIYELCNFLYSL